ncbi:hypothetical protein C1646_761716 [Rhizophagus diaphanus]|nr:hypothetical protein C1646_761716 [Rhizophagus diaphanus] [Rhizophagus sp. MUCL 43196]
MCVNLAKQTLSKDVENAMKMIDELKEISAGIRVINCKNEIPDWFVIRNNQKTSTINWISLQCQFDLLLSIQDFLDMVKNIFTLYSNVTIKPHKVLQDMLKGLFGIIQQLGRSNTKGIWICIK